MPETLWGNARCGVRLRFLRFAEHNGDFHVYNGDSHACNGDLHGCNGDFHGCNGDFHLCNVDFHACNGNFDARIVDSHGCNGAANYTITRQAPIFLYYVLPTYALGTDFAAALSDDGHKVSTGSDSDPVGRRNPFSSRAMKPIANIDRSGLRFCDSQIGDS